MFGTAFIVGRVTRFAATKFALANGASEEEARKYGRNCGRTAGAITAVLTFDPSGIADIAIIGAIVNENA